MAEDLLEGNRNRAWFSSRVKALWDFSLGRCQCCYRSVRTVCFPFSPYSNGNIYCSESVYILPVCVGCVGQMTWLFSSWISGSRKALYDLDLKIFMRSWTEHDDTIRLFPLCGQGKCILCEKGRKPRWYIVPEYFLRDEYFYPIAIGFDQMVCFGHWKVNKGGICHSKKNDR